MSPYSSYEQPAAAPQSQPDTNSFGLDRHWAIATSGRVVAFVLASFTFYSLMDWEASAPGAEGEGFNFLAGLVFLPVQVVSALAWGAVDGWRNKHPRGLLIRWALVAVSVSIFVVMYSVVTLDDPLESGEIASALLTQGTGHLVTIFAPAAAGALGGVKAANRRTPFFHGHTHLSEDR